LGIALSLITYSQFRALPGQQRDSIDLTTSAHDFLAACISDDTTEVCPFPLNYMGQVNTLPDAAALFLVVARFVIFLGVTQASTEEAAQEPPG
jgi:hypothetical protein